MIFRNLIFQAEVVKQGFRAVYRPIMISRPPTMEIQRSMSNGFLLLHASTKSHLANLSDFFISSASPTELWHERNDQ